MNRKFNVGDKVIGISYPDDVPAKVVEVCNYDTDFPLVLIEFEHNGRMNQVLMPEYRLKLL